MRARPLDRRNPWTDERWRAVIFQVVLVLAVAGILAYFAGNAVDNLRRQGITSGFGFLDREASFEISSALIAYSPSSSYGRAFVVGLLNTLLVSGLGIIFATLLGFIIGIARLSSNWLLRKLMLVYVEVFRNTPLLLQLFVWWNVFQVSAPAAGQAWQPLPDVYVSVKGVALPVPVAHPAYAWMGYAALGGLAAAWAIGHWARQRSWRGPRPAWILWLQAALIIVPPVTVFLLNGAPLALDAPRPTRFGFRGGESVSPEFAALLLGLVLYTAAFIGEIVRGGVQSVPRGQVEAASALGLRRGQVLRLVVLPQAIRVIIPPLTSEYLNLTKNSSLAAAIGFPDLVSVGNTVINQTGQVIEAFFLVAIVYETVNLATSAAMNLYGRRVALVER